MMTFTQALIASGYYFQPECGAFHKADRNGNSHSYVEQSDNIWSYERYNKDSQLVISKVFSLEHSNEKIHFPTLQQ
jgi:hypothetical protein